MGVNEDRAHTVARLNSLRGQGHGVRAPSSGSGEARLRGDAAWADSADEHAAKEDVSSPNSLAVPADPDWLIARSDSTISWWSNLLPQRWRSARVDPGRRGVVALAGAGAVVVLLAAFAVLRDSPTPAAVPPLAVVTGDVAASTAATTAATSAAPAAEVELVVSVVGLVAHPGLVRLHPDSRIADAVAATGGALDGADLLALNMAARVADGDQIVVGVAPPQAPPPISSAVSSQGSSTDADGPVSAGVPGGATPGATVDLNAATAAELDALPGVGPVTAASIVSWREINGRFSSADQLAEVDGIGPGRLAKIRDLVHVR